MTTQLNPANIYIPPHIQHRRERGLAHDELDRIFSDHQKRVDALTDEFAAAVHKDIADWSARAVGRILICAAFLVIVCGAVAAFSMIRG